MRRSIGLYLDGRLPGSDPAKQGTESAESVESLMRASMSLRQTLKTTECQTQKMVLHTQLDKLERQLLRQLGTPGLGKTFTR